MALARIMSHIMPCIHRQITSHSKRKAESFFPENATVCIAPLLFVFGGAFGQARIFRGGWEGVWSGFGYLFTK